MKEMLINLARGLKLTFSEKSNLIIGLLIFNIIYCTYLHLETCNLVNHTYFRTKASLEDINNVEIDSYDGKLKHKLTTEEELIRKQNRRFHIRNLFK